MSYLAIDNQAEEAAIEAFAQAGEKELATYYAENRARLTKELVENVKYNTTPRHRAYVEAYSAYKEVYRSHGY